MEEIRTPEDYVRVVTELNGFSVEDIASRKIGTDLVNVRSLIANVLREEWSMTYVEIAKVMGFKDHTRSRFLAKRKRPTKYKMVNVKTIPLLNKENVDI